MASNYAQDCFGRFCWVLLPSFLICFVHVVMYRVLGYARRGVPRVTSCYDCALGRAVFPGRRALIPNSSRCFQTGLNQDLKTSSRTHTCGGLSIENVGEQVTLVGWVKSTRLFGNLLFIAVRDSYGVTQVTCDSSYEDFSSLRSLHDETVVSVKGIVRPRPDQMSNIDMLTGSIEVHMTDLAVVNNVEQPAPMHVSKTLTSALGKADEITTHGVRLQHRHIDLRGPDMQRNLRVRSSVFLAGRQQLCSHEGFVEVETPLLFKSTPEGAREFLVPVRSGKPGACFALPQSPQQYKQLLMVGGVDRYFQFAKCFRDESGRADRQPEFTQLDIEMSFVEIKDIQNVVEGVVRKMWSAARDTAETYARTVLNPAGMDDHDKKLWTSKYVPRALTLGEEWFTHHKDAIPVMDYNEAMERFGSDKPDTRFGMELSKFEEHIFPPETIARAIVVPGWKPTRKESEIIAAQFSNESVAVCVVQLQKESKWGKLFLGSTISDLNKRVMLGFGEDEKRECSESLGATENDTIVLVMNNTERVNRQTRDSVCSTLGDIRLHLHKLLFGDSSLVDKIEFLWVTGFPMFEVSQDTDGTNSLSAVHHPFTMPVEEDADVVRHYSFAKQGITKETLSVRAQNYDLVCNGMELGGGSVRIHCPKFQRHVMENILMVPREKTDEYFGHLLNALGAGCPPHAGIALGMDRVLSIMCGAPSLSDVIAFPKSASGNDILTGAPTVVPDTVWSDYRLKTLK
mmetsp:Transcript_30625/g.49102  ORF Transcript_30625/g.49102 Transcript_30625/m.49102 type:complete len:740 (-) Transcript_30625:895-3114(-)